MLNVKGGEGDVMSLYCNQVYFIPGISIPWVDFLWIISRFQARRRVYKMLREKAIVRGGQGMGVR